MDIAPPTDPTDTAPPADPTDTAPPADPTDTSPPTDPMDIAPPTDPMDIAPPTDPTDTESFADHMDTSPPTDPRDTASPTDPTDQALSTDPTNTSSADPTNTTSSADHMDTAPSADLMDTAPPTDPTDTAPPTDPTDTAPPTDPTDKASSARNKEEAENEEQQKTLEEASAPSPGAGEIGRNDKKAPVGIIVWDSNADIYAAIAPMVNWIVTNIGCESLIPLFPDNESDWGRVKTFPLVIIICPAQRSAAPGCPLRRFLELCYCTHGPEDLIMVATDLEDDESKRRIMTEWEGGGYPRRHLLTLTRAEMDEIWTHTADLARKLTRMMDTLQAAAENSCNKTQWPQKSNNKLVIRIFSRDAEVQYSWLMTLLGLEVFRDCVQSVRPCYISNTGFLQFYEDVNRCTFGILYHSKNRGRINVTNIEGSLYDEELEHLSSRLGKEKVIVVIDDLEDSSDDHKTRILEHQPSIMEKAKDLFLISPKEKSRLMVDRGELERKLQMLRDIIREKTAGARKAEKSEAAAPKEAGGNKDPAAPIEAGGNKDPAAPKEAGGNKDPAAPKEAGGNKDPAAPKEAGGNKDTAAPKEDGGDKDPAAPIEAGGNKDTAAPKEDGGDKDPAAPIEAGGNKDPAAPKEAGGNKDPAAPIEAGGNKDPAAPKEAGGNKAPAAPKEAGGNKDPAAPIEAGGNKDTAAPKEDGGDKDPAAPIEAGGNKDPAAPKEAGGDKDPAAPKEAGGDKEAAAPKEAGGNKDPAAPKEAGGNKDTAAPKEDGGDKDPAAPIEAGGNKDPAAPIEARGDKEAAAPKEAAAHVSQAGGGDGRSRGASEEQEKTGTTQGMIGRVWETFNSNIQGLPTSLSVSKKSIGIFSRCSETEHFWLGRLLGSEDFKSQVQSVRPCYISNTGFLQFYEDVNSCTFGILYHSKNRGRINVTNVTDSLYDEELEHLSSRLGQKNVIVVIDDLEDPGDTMRETILSAQYSIKERARDLILVKRASAEEKMRTTKDVMKHVLH
ncbi:uncharacterized protein [Dendropsophus ebraccatus]|uniref:uncharacterized protein isoform X2 n=1 Tax=Dendropsophus ebraccatus TaxID=150705 RepID=UPI003831376A